MSQTKAQLLDNIKDNVQLDARNSLRFADTDSSHYVAFKAPATVSSNVTWTLPAADGSANYVLATDGSGTLSWIADPAGQWTTSGSNIYFTGGNVGIGDSSPSNPLSVTGASVFDGDVTLTGASYNVTWDKSADDLIFNDNAKAAFGTSSDLQIYHDGSNSYLKNAGTGNIIFLSDDVQFKSEGGGNTGLTINTDGAVELYHNNSKKFETTSAGVTVTGNVNLAADNNSFTVGTGQDLQIYHDGTNNILRNVGTRLDVIVNSSETAAVFNPNTSVDLYYDNVKTFETISEGVRVQGNEGASAVLELWADQGDDNGDKWRLVSDQSSNFFYLQNYASGGWESTIRALGNGNVELYYDNLKRFETISTGAAVYGDADTEARLRVIGQEGRSAELQLWADDGDDYTDICRIHQSTNGNLYIQNNTGQSAWENFIVGTPNSSLTLYYDNDPKAWTYTSGLQVKSTTRIQGVAGGNATLLMYADDAGQNADYWKLSSEHVGNGFTIASYAGASWQTVLKATDSRTIELHYQDSKKFETDSSGCTLTGRLNISSNLYIEGTGELNMVDQGNKYFDAAHLNHYLYFRRIDDGDTAHAVTCSVSTAGLWSADFNDTSDEKLKENINTISDGAINHVKQLRPVTFDWKDPTKENNVSGFVAQEIKTVLPNLVYGTEYDPTIIDDSQGIKSSGYSVNTIGVVAHLTKALQEAITKIETLETKVSALESA